MVQFFERIFSFSGMSFREYIVILQNIGEIYVFLNASKAIWMTTSSVANHFQVVIIFGLSSLGFQSFYDYRIMLNHFPY